MDPERLLAVPLFAHFEPAQRAAVAAVAREQRLPAGTTVIEQGDLGTELFALLEGSADVVRDGERVATLGAGDVFGESGVLRRTPRSASVVATATVVLVVLTAWDLKRLTRAAPFVARHLRDLITQREMSM